MSPSRPFASSLRLLLVVAAMASFTFVAAAPASAAIETTGSGTVAIGSGKAGKALGKARVSVVAVKPATSKRKGGLTSVVAPASSVAVGSTTTVGLRGGIAFKRGKAKASFSKLKVKITQKRATVTGVLGGKRLSLVTGSAASVIDPVERRIRLSGAKVSLTGDAAKALRKKLKLRKLPAGPAGTLSVSVRWTEILPLVDPYFEQCGIAASSKLNGSLPAPAPLPVLTGAKPTVGAGVNWGFRESFRNYIFGAGGSMQALDGAGLVQTGPSPSSFTWPNAPGSYTANDPVDLNDDQAIVNSTGSVLFCNSPHGFRVVISNPTVVIDGDQGRIIADVDANFTNKWIPSQRIDFATLDLTGVTPFYNRSGAEVTWSDVPVKLTQSGADAICGTGDAPVCGYAEGNPLDPISVTASRAYDTSDPAALADYSRDSLPFPIPAASDGGCDMPGLPGPGDNQLTASSLTVDGDGKAWQGVPPQPAPVPALAGGINLTGGGIEWGFRNGLRASIAGTGKFNLSGGATASNPAYFGFGGTAVSLPGGMGAPPDYFTWPRQSGSASLGAPGTGDDRLVLQGQGRVAFCQDAVNQRYGLIISNPRIVLDGVDSRLTADVATRFRFSWARGVVDLAKLKLDEATYSAVPAPSGVTATWSFAGATGSPNVGPVELTKAGESVLKFLQFGPNPTYVQGLGLGALKIQATIPDPG